MSFHSFIEFQFMNKFYKSIIVDYIIKKKKFSTFDIRFWY